MRSVLLATVIVLGLSASALAQSTTGVPATGSAAADGAASDAPKSETKAALECLLGMAPKGCEEVFVGRLQQAAWRAAHYGPNPYFRSAEYAGRDDRGDYVKDVWDVKFLHADVIYLIRLPDPDGKIRGFNTFPGPLACENQNQPGKPCNPRRAPKAG